MQIKFECILDVKDEVLDKANEVEEDEVLNFIKQNFGIAKLKVSAKTNDMKRFRDVGLSIEQVKELLKELEETK